jgi:hypothetical protein
MKRFSTVICLAGLWVSAAQAATPLEQPWVLQMSGTAQHFKEPENERRRWNQKNWGLGVQYEQAESWPGWTRVYSAGYMKDSLGVGGLYAGVVELNELGVVQSVQFQAGIGLFGLWRTFGWKPEHKFVVAPLPVMHVEDLRTGVGLNVLVTPPVSFGSDKKVPGFAFFQLTKRF